MKLERASQLISNAHSKKEAQNVVKTFAKELKDRGLGREQQLERLRQLGNRNDDRRKLVLNENTDPDGHLREITTAAIKEIRHQMSEIGGPDE